MRLIVCCIFGLLLVVPAQARPVQYLDRVIEREGISMHLRVESIDKDAPPIPYMGQSVRLRIDGKRLADNQPLSNWSVGAWLDRKTDAMSGAVPVCGQRVAQYLSGNLIHRPILDLTGYYVLSLDAEPSVSVLDPSVSFSGKSSLYTAMKLDGRGFDWLKTIDDTRLFVALPEEKKLVIIDLQTMQVLKHLRLPGQPTRLALHPDERLLWVGQASMNGDESAVDVIDTISGESVVHIPLPVGHHEVAFSGDGRHAYVSSRQAKTLTIVDAIHLKVIREVNLGIEPLGLVFINDEALLWIVDAKAGRVHRYDSQGNALDIVVIEPGLGPTRLTPDGRYVLIVNPSQHRLYVLDAKTGKEKHRITVSGQPYDLMFSDQYAYIRTLASEQVGLISLASLDAEQVFVKFIPIGTTGLMATADLPRASSMTPTLNGTGAFFASPTERTLYHYMEGMNAPDMGLRTYGHTPVAAMVVQRGLREIEPGQYSTIINLPSAGSFVLALASETPNIRECLGLKVEAGKQTNTAEKISILWLSDHVQKIQIGERIDFHLRIKDADNNRLTPLTNLRLRIIPASGGNAVVWPLQTKKNKPGEWFAGGVIDQVGGYYVHIESNQPLQSIYTTVLVSEKSNEIKK